MTAQLFRLNQSEQERRWAAYVDARQRAEETMKYEDGCAAGRAWAAFMEVFVREKQ